MASLEVLDTDILALAVDAIARDGTTLPGGGEPGDEVRRAFEKALAA